LKPAAPLFCSNFFQPAEKGGKQSVSSQKKWDCGRNLHEPAQTGSNRHKPAQTGTNRTNHKPAQTGTMFVPRDGGSSLAPFSLFVAPVGRRPHPHTFTEGRGAATPLAMQGVWQRGVAEGRMRSPTLFPHPRHHIRRRCHCGPIMLP